MIPLFRTTTNTLFPARKLKHRRVSGAGHVRVSGHSYVRLERFSLAKFGQYGFCDAELLFPNKIWHWSALLVWWLSLACDCKRCLAEGHCESKPHSMYEALSSKAATFSCTSWQPPYSFLPMHRKVLPVPDYSSDCIIIHIVTIALSWIQPQAQVISRKSQQQNLQYGHGNFS
jgi:hypothetical protein